MKKNRIVIFLILTTFIFGCGSNEKNRTKDYTSSVDSIMNSDKDFNSIKYEVVPYDNNQPGEEMRFTINLKGNIKNAETYQKLLKAISLQNPNTSVRTDSLNITTECDNLIGTYKGNKKDFMGPEVGAEITVSKNRDEFTIILNREIKEVSENAKNMSATFRGVCNGSTLHCTLTNGLWHQEELDFSVNDSQINFGNTIFYK